MKKVILLLLAGIALFAFIFTTSILWYRFFYNAPDTNTVGSVNVNLSNYNNTINESNFIPLDDETAKGVTPYEFTVNNNSEADSSYEVLLEDSIISDDSTYSNKDLLSRNQLKYYLSLNGQIIKSGYLSDLKNNVLDTRVISSSQFNNYQLRIYVPENVQDSVWQNKYYHFNVRVEMKEDL